MMKGLLSILALFLAAAPHLLISLSAQEAEIIGSINEGTPPAAPAPEEPKERLGPTRIVSSVEHDLGDHRLVMQRITPPEVIVRQPSAEEVAQAEAEESAAFDRLMDAADGRFLSLGATVYNHEVTRLTWYVGEEQFEAWSNVDFAHIIGAFSEIEDAQGNRYHLHFAWSEVDTSADNPAQSRNNEAASAPAFSSANPQFIITQGDSTTEGADQVFEGLAAPHELYAQNQAELIQAYQGRKAQQAQWQAEEAARATNPPPPDDVVIQFWPGVGSRYFQQQAPTREDAR